VLEDPSNLFVLDLATTASESAGVPPVAQTVSCLFLGCCFLALSDLPDDNGSVADGDGVTDGLIHKRMFIGMIDSRIGLSRFTESLKKALLPSQSSTYSQLFVSEGFKAFYIKQFEAIKNGIISFYAGSSTSSSLSNSPQQQVIEMQQLRIAELEHALKLQNYIVGWNAVPIIPPIKSIPQFSHLIDIVNKSYDLEYQLLKAYNDVSSQVLLSDLSTFDFLQELRIIQNQSVAEYADLLNAAELVNVENNFEVLYYENTYFG
jgi:hypothetical protein